MRVGAHLMVFCTEVGLGVTTKCYRISQCFRLLRRFLFFAGTYAAEATKEHPKPTTGRIFMWQDAQSAFPYSEPLGTMPCKAETAELAQ